MEHALSSLTTPGDPRWINSSTPFLASAETGRFSMLADGSVVRMSDSLRQLFENWEMDAYSIHPWLQANLTPELSLEEMSNIGQPRVGKLVSRRGVIPIQLCALPPGEDGEQNWSISFPRLLLSPDGYGLFMTLEVCQRPLTILLQAENPAELLDSLGRLLWHLLPAQAAVLIATSNDTVSVHTLAGTCSWSDSNNGGVADLEFWKGLPAVVFYRQRLHEIDRTTVLGTLIEDTGWQEILVFAYPGFGVLLLGFDATTLGETFATLLINSLGPAWKAAFSRQVEHQRFRQLDQAVQQSAASIVITDTEGSIQFVNPAFTSLTGYTFEECIGKNPRLLKSQLTQPEVYEAMWADLLQKKKWSGVFCNRKKNGDLYWESAVISPIVDEDGAITHFVAVKENITDKIAAELKAKQKTHLLEEVMTNLPGILLVVGQDKRLLHWNTNLEMVTGLTAEKLQGIEAADVFSASYQHQFLNQIQRQFSGQSFDPFEVELVHTNLKSSWFYLTAVPLLIDQNPSAMVVGIDITDRKKLRAQIKNQGVRYAAILDQVTDAISLIDPTGKSIFNTPSVFRMYGYTPEEMTGIDLFTLLHPDDVEMARNKYNQMIAEGWPSARVEVRVQHKDGFYLMVDTVGVNLLDDPAVGAVLLSSRDITQKQKAAEVLENERRQLHTLMDSIPDSIYIKDLHARKLIANETDRVIMDLKNESDFVGKTDLDLYPYEVGLKGYSDDIYVLSTGHSIHDREEIFRDSSGHVKWLLTSKVPLRNTNGEITGLLGIGRDITQRKLAVDEIRASNERFELLSRATFDVVWDMEIGTSKLVWSDNYEAQFGHSISDSAEVNYRNWLEHIHPDDVDRVQASFEHALASGQELWREQYRFRKADQQYAFIRDRGILVRDLAGKPIRMLGAMQDVTREHEIQEKLLDAERRFRVLIENSSDGTVLLNINLEPIYLSPSVERLLGYNLAQDKLINIANLIHPDDLEYVIDWQRRVMEQPGIPQSGLSRIKHKNGSWRWKSSTITNLLHVPQVAGIVENFKDVTEQVEVERAVLTERDLSNSIINSLPGIFYLRQLDGKMLRWNRDLIRISGYTEAELSEINPIDLYADADQLKLRMLLNRYPYLESTGLELMLKAKDGTQVPLFVNLHAIDYEGQPCVVVVGIDISDRKRAEAENKKLGMIASLTINAVILTDTSGRITWVNQGFERMTGYTFEEVNGRVPGALLQGPETDPATIAMMHECFLQVRGYKTEVLNYTKRGFPYWVEIEVVPLFDEQNKHTGYMAMERDITERRDTEIQMSALNQSLRRQTEDLASSNEELERFAYVASHDLQEPLRMVSGFLNLIKARYGNHFDETGLQYIDFAVNGANRMKQLIIDLLNYSRVGTDAIDPEPVDLNELIAELRVIFQKEIDELGAVINAVDLPVLVASRMQMFQLMQNLIGNALKYRSERKPVINVTAKQLEAEWEIAVSDNGIGMETQYLERIFIIFQRLHGKDEYGGTGIGLTICKKIVEKHGGKIWAESVPGEGSTFIFRLPQQPITKSLEKSVSIPKVDL